VTSPLSRGKYTVGVSGLDRSWRLESISANQVVADNDVFEIRDADLTVTVALTTASQGAVSGYVRDAKGVARADAFVYMFPSRSELWIDFGMAPRRLKAVATDPSGKYVLSGPDGEYFLIATPPPVADSWMGRPVLERLARSAERIKLQGGASVNRDLVAHSSAR
jgi:hypothetical protein